MTEWMLLGLSLLLMLSCGVFGAAEYSLVAVDRAAVERAADSGDKRAQGTLAALRTLSTQLSGAQLGITITNLAIGFLAEPAIGTLLRDPLESLGLKDGALRAVAYGIALVVSTIVTMLVGELMPKNLALSLPLQTARRDPMGPAGIHQADGLAHPNAERDCKRDRAIAGRRAEGGAAFGPSADRAAVAGAAVGAQGAIDDETADLVARSIAFGDRTAADVRTPRVRVTSSKPRHGARRHRGGA